MSRCGPARRVAAAAAALAVLAACGKKGPPLAPLHLVPARVEDLAAVRRGSDVELRFRLPNTNVNGPGAIDLERVDVYAMTVAPGAPTPPNRELLARAYLVGTVPVKPLPEEGGPVIDEKAGDTRPSPGEQAVFVETLTEEKVKPAPQKAPAPVPAAQKKPEPLPFLRRTGAQHAQRVYVVRGATRGGRPGQPSAQVAVPLSAVPPAPSDVEMTYTETQLTIAWQPPPALENPTAPEIDEWLFLAPQFPYLFYQPPPPETTFNVYRAGEPLPVNSKPIAEAEFVHPGVEFGTEACYVVRTVRTSAAVAVESDASPRACVTPVDTFPPAAPQGLQAVAGGTGDINLSWDPNTEADLAGYLVLRGESPDAALQALTAAPVTETRYRDTTVVRGVRYFYAVVAVDKAAPPNLSPESARADETAR